MHIEIMYLATSSLISFLEDVNHQNSNFVQENDLSPYKIYKRDMRGMGYIKRDMRGWK